MQTIYLLQNKKGSNEKERIDREGGREGGSQEGTQDPQLTTCPTFKGLSTHISAGKFCKTKKH
jgi:hypothetical protein